jgi:hypothetical protein
MAQTTKKLVHGLTRHNGHNASHPRLHILHRTGTKSERLGLATHMEAERLRALAGVALDSGGSCEAHSTCSFTASESSWRGLCTTSTTRALTFRLRVVRIMEAKEERPLPLAALLDHYVALL